MTTTPPTGEQYALECGPVRAVITQVAAGLRVLEIEGVALTPGYPVDATPPYGCGITLAPWPNRVKDGRWILDGVSQQLDLTEVARMNALHGLLRTTEYRLLGRAADSVTLGARIYPQHGYPFLVDTSITYSLVDDGLDTTQTATNLGDRPAPVAFGTHPFFCIGGVDTADLELTLHAGTRFVVDERLNPTGIVPVDGDYDLRGGRAVGVLELDTAFGEVATVDGVSAVLRAPDGREVRVLQDDNHGYVQVFTTRDYPGHSLAVAIEPMTAPPDAFNSGLGVRWLEPGETWSVRWGVRYSGGNEGE